MVSPQLKNGFIGIANEIWDEIISRKFTERQQKILKLIIRLSYGCQKKKANIPLLTHFELCGVRIQDAKKEITYLKQCKVIEWDEKQSYALNKNYDQWRVSLVKEWDEAKFKELISLNLSEIKLTKSVSSEVSEEMGSYEKCKSGVTKSVSGELRKVELSKPESPCDTKDEGSPKDSIKDNIKDIKDSSCLEDDGESSGIEPQNQSDIQDATLAGTGADSDRTVSDLDYRNQIADKYLRRKGKGLDITSNDESVIDEFIKDKIPLNVALSGIDKAFDSFKQKHKKDEIHTLSYCSPVVYSLFAQQPTSEDPALLDAVPEEETMMDSSDEEYQRLLSQLRSKRGDEAV
ncbi:replication protein [Paenibacillus dokdonensis]|uniref:Replication protein n=1 Tax=Paenibacillus dokdonensis TaxID=2567944 RepID=A0ABU6GQK8_9BACL|nr:replication protein [Paenibacillus dokdonensis]MEC0242015.1 replication protein [Paenibacillus dokdonensis]